MKRRKRPSPPRPGRRKVAKSAITGRFVKASYAMRYPHLTIWQPRRRA